MRPNFRRNLIATTAILGLASFAASAAPATTTPPSAEVIQAAATPDRDMTAKVEARITALHTTLKITPAQQPLWDAFALTMRDNAKAMDQAYQHRVTSMAGMNAADNMRNYADMSAAHAQGMQKMAPAFGTLYGALSPEQKQTADAEFVDHAHQGADKPKT